MDPLEKLDLPWDTSLCLLRELTRRGHECIHFTLSDLASESGKVFGRGLDLSKFDTVFIRKDPPFDAGYLALTYLLEPVAKKTQVINHPRGIRNANEKMAALAFRRWSPPTVVAADPEEILAFQRRIRADLVVKPLYEKGGKGIFLVRRRGGFKTRPYNQLQRTTRKGKIPVLAQKFIPVPKGSGDKRILLWKGKLLGAFARIPKPGEFRSNLSLGARFARCSISSSEKGMIQALKPFLLKEGLLFVGLDTRGDKLIEVNVTSPAGLVELDQLYGGATAQVADDLERM